MEEAIKLVNSLTKVPFHSSSINEMVTNVAKNACALTTASLALCLYHDEMGREYVGYSDQEHTPRLYSFLEQIEHLPSSTYSGSLDAAGEIRKKVLDFELKSVTWLPLIVEQKSCGLLLTFSSKQTPPDLHVLELLLSYLERTLQFKQLFRQQKELIFKLQQLQLSYSKQNETLENLILLQKTFTNPQMNDYDSIIEKLGDYLGPVLLLDKSLRMITACTPITELDGSWIKTLEKRYLDSEIVNHPQFQLALRKLLTGKEYLMPIELHPNQTYLLYALRSRGEVWGFLFWTKHLSLPQKNQVLSLAEMALTLVHVQQQTSVLNQYNSFFELLITGQQIHYELLLEQASHLGCNLRQVNHLMVIQIKSEKYKLHELRDVVAIHAAKHSLGIYTTIYKHAIILFIESQIKYKELANDINTYLQSTIGRDFIIGVTRFFNHVSEIRDAYDEVVRSLVLAKKLGRENEIIFFEDLGVYRLLLATDRTILEKTVQQALQPLLSNTQFQSRDLLETLSSYIRSGGSLQQTAKECYIHLNTVKYRLKQISQLLNIDLSSSEERFKLDFSLRALEVLEM